MKKIRLLLVVHHHQPVGASQQQLEDAYFWHYLPFLDCFDEFPKLRLTLHLSGGLLEWLAIHQPEYLDRVGGLVAEGRLELLGGAFYDPVLPWLNERDAVGQIHMGRSWLRERLGTEPSGVWLAEQVWEPSLPRVLARAGASYSLVSGRAFELGGYREDPLFGYYMTESQGESVAVFPLDAGLGELFPDASVGRIMAYLSSLAADDDDTLRALTGALSGERLETEWLQELFQALSDHEVVEAHPVGEFLDAAPPSGRVYLPSASRSKAFFSRLLVEHPESNWMLQRIHRVSALLARAMGGDRAVESAGHKPPDMLRSLWRATCCDAFVPPGVYDPQLRHANYGNLLRAEEAVEQTQRSRGDHLEHAWLDLDKDGHDEVEVTGQYVTAYVKPSAGGALAELDLKERHVNVLNTLRPNIDGSHAVPRWSFVDHLYAPDTTLDTFSTRSFEESPRVTDLAFRVVATDFAGAREAGVIHLAGTVPAGDAWLEIEKSFVFSRRSPALAVRYRLTNTSEHGVELWFGTELNLHVAGHSADQYLEIPGIKDPGVDSHGEIESAAAVDLVSPDDGLRIAARFDEGTLWWHPLETFRSGGVRAFQGTCLAPSWKVALKAGASAQRTVRLAFSGP